MFVIRGNLLLAFHVINKGKLVESNEKMGKKLAAMEWIWPPSLRRNPD